MNENRRKFVEVLKGMDNTVFNLCNDIQNMPGIGPGLEPGDLAKSVKMNLLQYSVFIICSDSVISEDEVEMLNALDLIDAPLTQALIQKFAADQHLTGDVCPAQEARCDLHGERCGAVCVHRALFVAQ